MKKKSITKSKQAKKVDPWFPNVWYPDVYGSTWESPKHPTPHRKSKANPYKRGDDQMRGEKSAKTNS
jgi:hypothetical protein